jgi:PKD repeat protein
VLHMGHSLWRKLVRNRIHGNSAAQSRRKAGRRARWGELPAAVERLEDRTLLSAVINNYPPTSTLTTFGEPNAAYFGQSFVAPAGFVEDLTFQVSHTAGTDAVEFHVLLCTTNGGTGNTIWPDSVLFESTTLSVPPGSGLTEFTVNLGGIDLVDGATYAWVLDAFVTQDGFEGKGGVGARSGYADGHAFFLQPSGGTRSSHFSSGLDWNDFENDDLAFELTFSSGNEDPVADAGPDQTVDEGDTVTFDGSGSSDADDDMLTYDWDFGDGSNGSGVGPTHIYTDNGTYTVILTVDDGNGGIGTDEMTVTVNNVAPTANAGVDQTANEGDLVLLDGSFSDPGSDDTQTFLWHVTASNGQVIADGTGEDFSFTPDDNGTYTIDYTVTDDDSGAGSDQVIVTVSNVDPDNVAIDAAVGELVFAVGNPQSFGGSFDDVGTADTHTAEWSFTHVVGLDTVTETRTGTVNQAGNTVDDVFCFDEAGVYTVTLTVTDDDTGTAMSESRTFVVYDPSNGFVIGGGWIDSPTGAYVPNATLTGLATFGFVSKYLGHWETLAGVTAFNFHAGDMNFFSTSNDWLVVAGARAQYQGAGRINGAGDYGFLLTVIDGQAVGGGGTDTLRMQIWDKDNGNAVVYDNGLGAPNDAPPPTPLGGGSIIIHTHGHAETAAPAAAVAGKIPVLSYDVLRPVVTQAIAYWQAAGASPEQIDVLNHVDVQIASLDGDLLGMASEVNVVWIDKDAAGAGWSVTDAGSFAGFDLLSVVSHELGHMLGLDDVGDASDVMGEDLSPGVRRLPDHQFAQRPADSGPETVATAPFALFELPTPLELAANDGSKIIGRWSPAPSDLEPWSGERVEQTDHNGLTADLLEQTAFDDTSLPTATDHHETDAVFADVTSAAWDALLTAGFA